MMVLRRGNSEEKLSQLANFRVCDLFSDKEKAALHYAEVITKSDSQVSQSDQQHLRQYFNDDEIVELTAIISFQNMSSKFNAALDVPPQGFCQIDIAEPDNK